MDKLVKDVLVAAEALELVAKNFHVPLDTSQLEKTVKALAAEARKLAKPAEKPAKPEPTPPTPRPAAN